MSSSAQPQLEAVLKDFCGRVPGVRHAVLASIDGFPIAHNLPPELPDGTDPEAAAAMVAATLGLGQRLVALIGTTELREAMVRSESGWVLCYAIGQDAVLTLLASDQVNLARAGIESREFVARLQGKDPATTSLPQPDASARRYAVA